MILHSLLLFFIYLLQVNKYENEISKSPLLILDANLSAEAMDTALLIAKKHSIPGMCSILLDVIEMFASSKRLTPSF